MDKEIKKFLQQKMEEESEQILQAVNSDPELADVELPDELHDKLFAQIRQYEEEKSIDRLSEEELDLIRLGMVYKKKRKRTKYYVLAAAIIAALAFGMTSIGGPEKLVEKVQWMLGGRKQINVDSGDGKVKQQDIVDEVEAYQLIEDKFGFKPVRMHYIPEGVSFQQMKIDETTQKIQLMYNKGKECGLVYRMITNYKSGSHGIDIEDEFVEEYKMQSGKTTILLRNYIMEENGTERWQASFEYQNVQYFLTAFDMEKAEFEKILKNLYFF